MLKLLLFLSIFNIGFLWAQDSSTSEAKISDKLKTEIKELEDYLVTIKEREKKAYEYRIRFSTLITKFATAKSFNTQLTEEREQLDKLDTETKTWLVDSEQRLNKIEDLVAITSESLTIYKAGLKKLKKKEAKVMRKEIARTNNFLKELERLKSKADKHHKFIIDFEVDLKKWRGFLVDKLKKNMDDSLLRWSLSTVYTEPISTVKQFQSSIKESFKAIVSFEYSKFFKHNTAQVILRLPMALVISILILIVLNRINLWMNKIDTNLLDPTFLKIITIFTDHKIILSSIGFLIYWPKVLVGPLSFDSSPPFLFILYTLILSLIWSNVGHQIVQVFVQELNKDRKTNKKLVFRTSPFLIFIISKSCQNYFRFEHEFFYFFNSLLLGLISFKLFTICMQFKIKRESYKDENIAVFLQSTKIFIAFFSGAIMISSGLEIIGFANLSRSIQLVVANNLLILALGWILYQSLTYFMDLKIRKSKLVREQQIVFQLFDTSRSAINVGFIILVSVYILKSWFNTIFVFSDFWSISLISFGDHKVTIGAPIKLVANYYIIRILYLLVVLSLHTFLLEKFKISSRHSPNIVTIVRYFFILIFASMTAAILGVTYKNIVIFASALGVGIGFGLQNIANNFISGIILLFEQPIRVGDIIEVDNLFATVKHIGIRSTIVETLDNSSVVIPNSDIVSNKLINWTLYDNVIAIKCEVGVAYGTDTQQVEEILYTVAQENEDLLSYPKPQVWFTEFGDSSLNFTLKAYITKPSDRHQIKSQIHHDIDKKFKECNITIPFPQRDLHLKEVPSSLQPS